MIRRIREYLDRRYARRNGWTQTPGERQWTNARGDMVLYLAGDWCLEQASRGHHIPMPCRSLRAAIDKADGK